MTKEDILFLVHLSKNLICPNNNCETCIIGPQCLSISKNTSSIMEMYEVRKKNVDLILSRIPEEMVFECLL